MTQPDSGQQISASRLLEQLIVRIAQHSELLAPPQALLLETHLQPVVDGFCGCLGFEPGQLGGMRATADLMRCEQGRHTRTTWGWMIGLAAVCEWPRMHGISPGDLDEACERVLPEVAEACRRFGIPVPEAVEFGIKVARIVRRRD